MLKSLGNDVLDAHGSVRIAPTLQLAEYKNRDILDAGDIIVFDEQKAIARTLRYASIVAVIVLSLIAQYPNYKGSFGKLFVANRKVWDNISFSMSDLIEMMKGKDLFRSYSRRTLVVANLCQGPPSILVLSLLALLH